MMKNLVQLVSTFVLFALLAAEVKAQNVTTTKEKNKVTVSTPGYSGGTIKVEIEGGSDAYRLEAQKLAQESLERERESQATLLRDRIPPATVSTIYQQPQQQVAKVIVIPEPVYIVQPTVYPTLPLDDAGRVVIVRKWVYLKQYNYGFYAANGRWYYWSGVRWVARPSYQAIIVP